MKPKKTKEIVLTPHEKSELNKYLYDTLNYLAKKTPYVKPRWDASLNELKELFFFWASQYNNGYFMEMDDAGKLNEYLVQEYEKYIAKDKREKVCV